MVISPLGAFSGSLSADPSTLPVQTVPALNMVSTGDVTVDVSGETMVARKFKILPDGTYKWSSSLAGTVWYTTDSWSVAIHISL